MILKFGFKKLKNFSSYAFVSFLSMGLSFIFMPLLTKYLSPADYGLIRLFNIYTSLLIPLIGLSANEFLRVAIHKLNKLELQTLFSSQFYWTIITFPILFIFFYFSLNQLINHEFSTINIFQIGILTIISSINSSYLIFLIQKKQVKRYVFTMFLKIIIEILFTVVLISIVEIGWEGRIYSWIAAETIILFISLQYFFKSKLLSFSVNINLLKRAITFSIPLIIHGLGRVIIDQSDLVFIEKFSNLKDVGLYSIGYQFGNLICIFCVIFQRFYSPYFFENMKLATNKTKWQSMKVNYIIILVSIVLVLILNLISPLIFQWFNTDYMGGLNYIAWIAISFVMYNGYQMFSLYFHYNEDTRYLTMFTMVAVILNLILNYYLVKKFNALGAAYATIITYSFYFLITAFTAIKKYNIPVFKKGDL
jgi:O-antigen/teichoic acid export membrane protein